MNEFVIKWQDSFNTNIKSIDDQHKKLFDLIAVFGSAYLIGEHKQIVSELLFELEDYTKLHFTDEEKHIRKIKGSVDENHLAQHREFEKTLHDLKFDFVSEDKAITLELLDYLRNWLQNHIIDIDKKVLAQ